MRDMKQILNDLGPAGMSVMREAYLKEIAELKARLHRLENTIQEIDSRQALSLAPTLFHQPTTPEMMENGSQTKPERIADTIEEIMKEYGRPMMREEIYAEYVKRTPPRERLAKKSVGNYLRRFKDIRFQKQGERGQSRWSLIKK